MQQPPWRATAACVPRVDGRMSDAPPHRPGRGQRSGRCGDPLRRGSAAASSSSTAVSSSSSTKPSSSSGSRSATRSATSTRASCRSASASSTCVAATPAAPGGCGDGGSPTSSRSGVAAWRSTSIASWPTPSAASPSSSASAGSSASTARSSRASSGLRSRSKASLTGAVQAGMRGVRDRSPAAHDRAAGRAAPSGLRAPLLGRPYGGPEVSVSEELRRAADPIWRAQHDHPFVRGIGDGTLDLERFRFWVRQDYRFLIEYGRLLALGAARAPDLETIVVSPTSARRRSATRWTFTALTPASSTSRRRSSRRNRWLLPPRATPTSSSGPQRRATSRSSPRHCFPACGASARSGSGSPRVAAPPMSATPSGSICTPRGVRRARDVVPHAHRPRGRRAIPASSGAGRRRLPH